MKALVLLSLRKTVGRAVLFGAICSAVASQIEVAETKSQVLAVMLLGFFSYLPDFVTLCIPFSSFIFFSSERQKFAGLELFGGNATKTVLKVSALVAISALLMSAVSVTLGKKLKRELYKVKGKRPQISSSVFLEGERIIWRTSEGCFAFFPEQRKVERAECPEVRELDTSELVLALSVSLSSVPCSLVGYVGGISAFPLAIAVVSASVSVPLFVLSYLTR